jgi:serine/threonine protein kinase/Tol biopolymer transport system component
MSQGPQSLEDLVRAICEGKAIDWSSLEQDASPGFHHKLAALRVVENIARLHQTAGAEPRTDDEDPSEPGAPSAEKWGHLVLLEHLASGAFGDVYRAWDSGLDREVALKLLRRSPDADAHADEALDEGRLLAKVHHPNVVTVHGAARFDGRAGIWMEFVRGRTLAEVVAQEGRLTPPRVAAIGVTLCHALAAVHRASLIHRDVKPQNVMLSDDGRIVLMDFGAGGSVRHAGLQHAGTPRYLAPEVSAGGPATVRSDIYSLGVTLRYLLTASALESSPTTTGGGARRLLSILARATSPAPDDRFESAQAFANALAKLAKPRWPLTLAGIAGTLAVASVVVLWLILSPRNTVDSARQALEESWQKATPVRAPLTPDQAGVSGAGLQGTFSLHGAFAGIADSNGPQESLVSFVPASGQTFTWLTYSRLRAHAESPTLSPDGTQLTYVWVDADCTCTSLRSVDRAGHVRTLMSGPDVVTIWTGAGARSWMPVLIGRATTRFDLAVVNITSGATKVLRSLAFDPRGISLSPDQRFVAFDMARGSDHGAPHDVIIHELASDREWPLLEADGDRAFPAWSPRGDRLFYAETARGVTTLRAVDVLNGRRSSDPAVLRKDLGVALGLGFYDDDTIAYMVDAGRSDVMVVESNASGRFAGQVPRRTHQGATMPAWSPDGRWLAWSDFSHSRGGIGVAGTDGQVVRVFAPSLDVLINPAWSGDSSKLAFWDVSRNTAILEIADLHSGRTSSMLSMLHSAYGYPGTIAWMPGGRELLASLDGPHIVAIEIATGTRRTIHEAPPADYIGPFYVSPDGHSLVFCEGHDEPSPIHVIPLSPQGLAMVRPASRDIQEAMYGWWPDGTSLLENRVSRSPYDPPANELWRLPLDGSRPEPLGITGTGIVYASVAQGGRRIAYSTQTWGQELWLLKPASLH